MEKDLIPLKRLHDDYRKELIEENDEDDGEETEDEQDSSWHEEDENWDEDNEGAEDGAALQPAAAALNLTRKTRPSPPAAPGAGAPLP